MDTNYRARGARKRVFVYQWCGITEVDYVCRMCETIVRDRVEGCQHCAQLVAAKRGAV